MTRYNLIVGRRSKVFSKLSKSIFGKYETVGIDATLGNPDHIENIYIFFNNHNSPGDNISSIKSFLKINRLETKRLVFFGSFATLHGPKQISSDLNFGYIPRVLDTYSRSKFCLERYIEELPQAHILYLADVYANDEPISNPYSPVCGSFVYSSCCDIECWIERFESRCATLTKRTVLSRTTDVALARFSIESALDVMVRYTPGMFMFLNSVVFRIFGVSLYYCYVNYKSAHVRDNNS